VFLDVKYVIDDNRNLQPSRFRAVPTAPEWAASGAKLGLALDVRFLSKGCPPEISQDTLLGGADLPPSSLLDVVPLNEPSFIGVNGQERVKVTPGAFSCRIQIPDTQQYNLNFFVDFVSIFFVSTFKCCREGIHDF
jgi:hypothetical protein